MTKMDSSETDLVGKDMRFHNENGRILLTARSVKCVLQYIQLLSWWAFLFPRT
jgi:predicted ABC-type transport system involved in lysophospholipase L1 biosynthesis ATPase subunit